MHKLCKIKVVFASETMPVARVHCEALNILKQETTSVLE